MFVILDTLYLRSYQISHLFTLVNLIEILKDLNSEKFFEL